MEAVLAAKIYTTQIMFAAKQYIKRNKAGIKSAASAASLEGFSSVIKSAASAASLAAEKI